MYESDHKRGLLFLRILELCIRRLFAAQFRLCPKCREVRKRARSKKGDRQLSCQNSSLTQLPSSLTNSNPFIPLLGESSLYAFWSPSGL